MAQIYTDPQGRRVYNDPQKGTVDVRTGQTLQPLNQPTPPGTITGNDLVSPPSPNFQTTPAPSPVTSPSTIDTTVPKAQAEPTLSTSEQRISDLIGQITQAREGAIGQTAFRTERRGAEGLPALEKTQEDIAQQIIMLQGQAKSLETSPEFERRNVLQPFAEGERGRALRDVGVKSNILSAQLLASQGKVASANARIDQAVLEKFGPQEEAIKIKIANLELFLKDPAITLAEKNRADAQLQIQKKEEAETAKKKQDVADAWKVLTDASINTANFQPTDQYTTPALALEAISKAGEKGDKREALQIASETGLTKTPTQPTGLGDITKFKAFFPNVDITTPAGQQQFLDWKARESAEVKALPSDIQTFKAFFPNVDITTPAGQQQYLNWKAREAAAGREPNGVPGVKVTPEDKRDLAGAGFSPAEINDIEKSVNDFGIEATLKAIDDENKRAKVAKTYNAQDVLDKVETELQPKPTKKWWQFWK